MQSSAAAKERAMALEERLEANSRELAALQVARLDRRGGAGSEDPESCIMSRALWARCSEGLAYGRDRSGQMEEGMIGCDRRVVAGSRH